MVVYGEWCGPGVEKGMAISALPAKVFAVFGIQRGLGEHARLVVALDQGTYLRLRSEGLSPRAALQTMRVMAGFAAEAR